MQIKIFHLKNTKDFSDYELLDTGEGEKLEKFGAYTFIRPYEDAVWPKCSTPSVQQHWDKADGKFWSSKAGAKAGWQMSNENVRGKASHMKWEMQYKGIKFLASPTPFRHLGFFPEQASHWDFIEQKILQGLALQNGTRPCRFLNLFGYTGVASLFALRAGAEVTHVDASKQSLAWAKENEKLNLDIGCQSGHPMSIIRIIEDDVIKFLEREIKRGNKYDAIIMDPPKFGRGPKGETWKIEEMLPKLLALVKKVLTEKPLFVILTSYAIESSSLSLGYALSEIMTDFNGQTEAGELCIQEKSKGRMIPFANTAVWTEK
jgi:23S rRNA (cytosine1962-C5)-methyltransferase